MEARAAMYMYVRGRSVCTCEVCVCMETMCMLCGRTNRCITWVPGSNLIGTGGGEYRDPCRKNGWGGMPFHLQLPLPHSHFFADEWGEGCVCVSSLHLHAWNHLAHSWSKAPLPSTDGWEILFIFSWWNLCITELSDLFRDQWRLTSLYTASHTIQVLYSEPTVSWAAEDYHPLIKNWSIL